MTYLSREASAADGAPFELFRFTRNTEVWPYTSGPSVIAHAGTSYTPVVISRGEIEATDEDAAAAVEIGLDPDLPFLLQFVQGAPASPVWITIIRGHEGEAETAVIFKGQVASSSRNRSGAQLRCVSVQAAMDRQIPRQVYQRTCNHPLYGPACGVSAAEFEHAGMVLSVSGSEVDVEIAATVEEGYFRAGVVAVPSTERRAFIVAHAHLGSAGDAFEALRLLAPIHGLAAGDAVKLYAGCDRTRETCLAKFDNLENFLGFSDIPAEDPYSANARWAFG